MNLVSKLLIIPAALVLFAFEVPKDWLMLKTPVYSIQYPPNWKSDRSGLLGTRFVLFSPKDSAGLRSFVSLSSQTESSDSITIDSILQINKHELPNTVEDYKLISEELVTIQNRPCFRLVYTGRQNNREMQWMQQGCMVGKEYHVLSFTATKNNYQKLFPTAEAILNTITFY